MFLVYKVGLFGRSKFLGNFAVLRESASSVHTCLSIKPWSDGGLFQRQALLT